MDIIWNLIFINGTRWYTENKSTMETQEIISLRISGFYSISNTSSSILILGSMPSISSLSINQYYGHPRNCFWTIISKLLNAPTELSYEKRKKLLLDKKIALWDVLSSCHRKGSLDSNIDINSIEFNDFNLFFSQYKNINHIFFNGQKSKQLFNKHVFPIMKNQKLQYHTLPSTSPAMAQLKFEEKYIKWSIIKEFI